MERNSTDRFFRFKMCTATIIMKIVTISLCSTDLNIATLFQKYWMNVYSAKTFREVYCCAGNNPVVADVLKDKL